MCNLQSQIIQPRNSIVLSEEPIGIKRKEFRQVEIANITELLSDKFRDDCPYDLDGLIFQPTKYVLIIFKSSKLLILFIIFFS